MFACAQIGAARHEEADQQLETLLALPVSRRSWLGGRLLLATCGAAGDLAGGRSAHLGPAPSLAVPAFHCQRCSRQAPTACPSRSCSSGSRRWPSRSCRERARGIAYGLVTVAFLWDLVGSLLGAPRWVVDLTPFEHVGLVPAQPFRGEAAAVMIGIGLVAALAALELFRRRDLLLA